MWCDIHAFSEKKVNNKWEYVWEVDFWRNYSIFGFLAWVRNYDCKEPLSEPRWIPDDISEPIKKELEVWEWAYHSASWFILQDLLDVDYEKTFWNRRISRTVWNVTNWACIAEEWEWKIESLKDNLWWWYFQELEKLKQIGNPENVRIIFWFDN